MRWHIRTIKFRGKQIEDDTCENAVEATLKYTLENLV